MGKKQSNPRPENVKRPIPPPPPVGPQAHKVKEFETPQRKRVPFYTQQELDLKCGKTIAYIEPNIPKSEWFKCRIRKVTKQKETIQGELKTLSYWYIEYTEDYCRFYLTKLRTLRKLVWHKKSRMEALGNGDLQYRVTFNSYEEAKDYVDKILKEEINDYKEPQEEIISYHP